MRGNARSAYAIVQDRQLLGLADRYNSARELLSIYQGQQIKAHALSDTR